MMLRPSNFEKNNGLTIRSIDANLAMRRPNLVQRLQKMTLNNNSGMSKELRSLENKIKYRRVDSKFLLAYKNKELVAWALLSKEDTNFIFPYSMDGYKSSYGYLFEVFVVPEFRRQGIGKALFQNAKRRIKTETLCVCPWDGRSEGFYKTISDSKTLWI